MICEFTGSRSIPISLEQSDPILGWDDLVEGWTQDPAQVKKAFLHLTGFLSERSGVVLRLKSRPGVSYSLRAGLKDQGVASRPLFALVDVVDDDPGQRWLSVCFYEDRVSDPLEMGNIVPNGLLGEDGYCFDVTEYHEEMMAYLEERILEAYAIVLTQGLGHEGNGHKGP